MSKKNNLKDQLFVLGYLMLFYAIIYLAQQKNTKQNSCVKVDNSIIWYRKISEKLLFSEKF